MLIGQSVNNDPNRIVYLSAPQQTIHVIHVIDLSLSCGNLNWLSETSGLRCSTFTCWQLVHYSTNIEMSLFIPSNSISTGSRSFLFLTSTKNEDQELEWTVAPPLGASTSHTPILSNRCKSSTTYLFSSLMWDMMPIIYRLNAFSTTSALLGW